MATGQATQAPMRFVHAVVSMNPLPGVVRQMDDEARAAQELGLDWQVRLDRSAGPAASPVGRLWRYMVLRCRFYLSMVRLARAGHVIVLRHSPGDPFFYVASFLLGRFFTVHHTLEESELASSKSRLARLQWLIERVLGRRALARAQGLVCVTREIARHEMARVGMRSAVFIYPNGILYPATGVAPPPDTRQGQPEILFVASHFFDWHGLDLLLDSMEHDASDGLVHVVGTVPEPLRARAQAESRIRLHGLLDHAALQVLAARCWLGLSSFGLSRKGMNEACTLKVRDYLHAGLAVYAGHADAGLPAGFSCYRQGPANWSDILCFASDMRPLGRRVVAEQARPYLDKRVLLARLHGELEAALQGRTNAAPAGHPR